MAVLPSYSRLSVVHQNFVLAYIHNGFDPVRACRFLAPADDEKLIRQRAARWMAREDIQEAIQDKTTAIQTKQTITRESMIETIRNLIARADNLPEGDANRNEKFAINFGLKAAGEINKILGYHIQHHVHTNSDTVIQFLDVDEHGNEIVDVPLQIEQGPQEDPAQLDISFPPEHGVSYSVSEILDPDNEISKEQDDDLPDDL